MRGSRRHQRIAVIWRCLLTLKSFSWRLMQTANGRGSCRFYPLAPNIRSYEQGFCKGQEMQLQERYEVSGR